MYYITSSFLSFGLTPAEQLNVPSVVANQSVDVSLPLATTGQVQRMDPLTNLQVVHEAYINRTQDFSITFIINSTKICTTIISTFRVNTSTSILLIIILRWLSKTTSMCSILLAQYQCMYSSLKMVQWRRKFSWRHGKTYPRKMKCSIQFKIVNAMQVCYLLAGPVVPIFN